jgi:uncharacterized protein (DUF58 family)
MAKELEQLIFPYVQEHSVQLASVFISIGLLSWLGRCIPTGITFVLFSVPVLISLAGFWLPFSPNLVHFYNILLLLAMLMDRFILSGKTLPPVVKRLTEKRWSIHRDNLVNCHIQNPNPFPLHIQLAETFPNTIDFPKPLKHTLSLSPHQTESNQTTISYFLHPTKRGKYPLGPTHIKYKSALGLVWIVQKLENQDYIKVYPDLVRLKQVQIRFSLSAQAGEIRLNRIGSDGTEFAGLRNYAAGDDLRHIDWQATARLDQPISRIFSMEVDQPLLILLDAGRKMALPEEGLAKFDWTLHAALGLSSVALKRGDQVSWGVFHRDLVYETPFIKGHQALNSILEAIYDIQPQPLEADYETHLLSFARKLKKRTLVVLFTDLVDPYTSKMLSRALQSFSTHHVLVLATIQDGSITQLAKQTPSSLPDSYDKAVAQDWLEERHLAKLSLGKTHRVSIIDAPAQTLDESLIRHYLKLKSTHRL